MKILFTLNTNLCVAGSDSGATVVIHNRNGGLGTVWFQVPENNHLLFESREFDANGGKWLCGRNDGSQFRLEPLGQGFFCRFDQN